jgi:GT2 family glycosyltransferase
MDLSIIIAGYNSRPFLQECLESIYVSLANSGLAIEVIYVDDASRSDDGSLVYLHENFPQVITALNFSNQGFSRTNNKGIGLSSGRYVLLLNADTLVKADALACLVNFMDAHLLVGAAGPQLLNPDGSLQPSGRNFPSTVSLVKDMWITGRQGHNQYQMVGRDYSQTLAVDEVSGAAIMVRREVLNKVGLLDSNIFLFYEDVDWCYRIHKAGWQIYYVAQAQIVHYGGQSTAQIGLRMQLEDTWSTYYYFRKHHGHWGAFQVVSLFILRDMLLLSLRLGCYAFLIIQNVLVPAKKAANQEKMQHLQKSIKASWRRLVFSVAYWPSGVSAKAERKKLPVLAVENS